MVDARRRPMAACRTNPMIDAAMPTTPAGTSPDSPPQHTLEPGPWREGHALRGGVVRRLRPRNGLCGPGVLWNTAQVKPGDVLAERFVLQRFVGAGGMGAVFLAIDRERGKPAAVKVLQVASADAAQRFDREARVLSELDHPAIVRHLATGVRDKQRFFAMEWLEGEDLAARLDRAPLTAAESIAVARRVADALAFAHSRGVVHRDVKPAADGRLPHEPEARRGDVGVGLLPAGRGQERRRKTTRSCHLTGIIGQVASAGRPRSGRSTSSSCSRR